MVSLRRIEIFFLSSVCLLCAGTSPSQAQHPEYSRNVDDRLTYREVSKSRVTMDAPQGRVQAETYHDAEIGVSYLGGDTATATYDALVLRLETPRGELAPDTDPVLGKPFVLEFPADGRVETIDTPDFPDAVRQVTDLRWQFKDFFLPLPDEPLEVGTTWTYTDEDEMDGQRGTKTTRFEVVGDTTIGGIDATIIVTEATNTIVTNGPGPSPGLTTKGTLKGTEHGRFFFSVGQGLLVGRERTGTMRGEIRYIGGAQPIVIPQEMHFESTIEFVRE